MKHLISIVLGVLLVTCIAFIALRAWSYPFVLDDNDQWAYIQGKNSLSECFTWDCYGLYRPVKNILYYGLLSWGGQAATLGHLLSLLFYLFTTGLVWTWFWRWNRSKTWAFVPTLMWALAPTQVSSLIWLTCANIVIATGALVGALLCYDLARECWQPARRRAVLWLVLSVLTYLFSLFCYEGAIVLPALILLVDWRQSRGRPWQPGNVLFLVPFVALALGFICLRWSVVPPAEGNPSIRVAGGWQISLASAYFTMQHLWTWLAPWGRQELLGTFVWGKTVGLNVILLCWLLVGWLLMQAHKQRHHLPDVTIGILWFFLAFLPMSNLIPFKNGPFGDYYLVIPSLGLVCAVTGLLRRGVDLWRAQDAGYRLRWTGKVCCFVLLGWRVASLGATIQWCDTWGHQETLCYQSMMLRPYSFRARSNLAMHLCRHGHLDEAEVLIQECIAQAPWVPIHYNILGDIQTEAGNHEEAEQSYRQTLVRDPNDLHAHFALARTYMDHLGKKAKAKEHCVWLLGRTWNRYTEDTAIALSRLQREQEEPDKALHTLRDTCRRSIHAQKTRRELQRMEARQLKDAVTMNGRGEH